MYGAVRQKTLANVIKRKLIYEFGYDHQLAVAETLTQHLIELFDIYMLQLDRVKPLQVVWMAVDRDDPPGYGKTIALTRQRVVVLDLWTQQEVDELTEGKCTPQDLWPQRAARVVLQTYQQGGLLTQDDVAMILGISTHNVAKALDRWQTDHDEVLPMRGTVHDIGPTVTHKRQILASYLQGLSTEEIARKTYHDPHSVDRYIADFQRVLELGRDNVPVHKIQFYTKLSRKVVLEYLEIIKEHNLIQN
jgi:DNA-binding CsgD family transcriptional regulator